MADMKWIPVTERLPSDCGEDWVLAFVVEDTGYKLIPKVAEYRKELGDWYCVDLGWLGQDHHGAFIVTHWMPLPEPPKEVVGLVSMTPHHVVFYFEKEKDNESH